ncbi:hypothetical protein QYE76_064030 [Lolium multiflorum]|uniref:DDE Tnp4 domain-containing protein n=1 Tax=Lolium multiflorum TaxID=4521 RepID=A0AAD8S6R8_LOLMU|nr:hypothetical protein QYE76_064030 [Lolium multiflorum]
MAAVDFDLRFTYVLAGWEGTAHDANVPFPVQVDIVVACCVLHNYALSQGIDEFILPEVTWTAQPIRSQTQQARDHRATVDRRQQIATQMWADRQIMYGH